MPTVTWYAWRMTYKAYNYAMGRVVETATFEALGDADARIIAERKLRGRHAQVMGGARGRVIGLHKCARS